MVNYNEFVIKIIQWFLTDVILDPLLTFRKELKGMIKISSLVNLFFPAPELMCYNPFCADKFGVKVSVNDIVIKTVAIALRNVPKANGKIL